MAEPTEALADQILSQMGPGPALVICMRLVLGVGHAHNETEGMLEAVLEAMSAIKRVGALAGSFALA